MHCNLYLRKGKVYIPTIGQMARGFYRGIEPVGVASATDTQALRRVLNEAFARGNPTVPVPGRDEWPPSVTLKRAGVRSWSAFVRTTVSWDIDGEDDIYVIAAQMVRPDGSLGDDPEQIVKFPAGTPVEEVIERMIAIVQEAAKLSSMNDQKG